MLTWNSVRHLKTALEKTLAAAEKTGLSLQFHVVDNGSRDGTQQLLKRLADKHSCIDAIFLRRNTGTTRPRNLALKRAVGHFICIMDSDAYPKEGCFEVLIQRLEENSKVGIVAPRLIYPDGRHQKSVDAFPTLNTKIKRLLFLRCIERHEVPPGPGPVDYAISAFWMFRRNLLQHVGYLDENIFYSPEDVDFCLRCWRKGYQVVYEPQAVVVHDAQEKSRAFVPNKMTWLHCKGLTYFYLKHRFLFKPPPRNVPTFPQDF